MTHKTKQNAGYKIRYQIKIYIQTNIPLVSLRGTVFEMVICADSATETHSSSDSDSNRHTQWTDRWGGTAIVEFLLNRSVIDTHVHTQI